jgi:hypothetical protein
MNWDKDQTVVEYNFLQKIHSDPIVRNYKFIPKIDSEYWDLQKPTRICDFVFDEYSREKGGRRTEDIFEELHEIAFKIMLYDFEMNVDNYQFQKRHGITAEFFYRKFLKPTGYKKPKKVKIGKRKGRPAKEQPFIDSYV